MRAVLSEGTENINHRNYRINRNHRTHRNRPSKFLNRKFKILKKSTIATIKTIAEQKWGALDEKRELRAQQRFIVRKVRESSLGRAWNTRGTACQQRPYWHEPGQQTNPSSSIRSCFGEIAQRRCRQWSIAFGLLFDLQSLPALSGHQEDGACLTRLKYPRPCITSFQP